MGAITVGFKQRGWESKKEITHLSASSLLWSFPDEPSMGYLWYLNFDIHAASTFPSKPLLLAHRHQWQHCIESWRCLGDKNVGTVWYSSLVVVICHNTDIYIYMYILMIYTSTHTYTHIYIYTHTLYISWHSIDPFAVITASFHPQTKPPGWGSSNSGWIVLGDLKILKTGEPPILVFPQFLHRHHVFWGCFYKGLTV